MAEDEGHATTRIVHKGVSARVTTTQNAGKNVNA